MDKEEKKNCNCECCNGSWKHHYKIRGGHAGGSAFYGMGFVGALFYFLQHAVTFNDYVWGIGKAIFWPALVVFKALTLLHL